MSMTPKIVSITAGKLPSQYLALGDDGQLYQASLHPDNRFYYYKGTEAIEGWQRIDTSLPNYG